MVTGKSGSPLAELAPKEAKSPLSSLEELSLVDTGPKLWGRINSLSLKQLRWLLGEELCLPNLKILRVQGLAMDVHKFSLPKLEEFDMKNTDVPLPGIPFSVPPCIFQTLCAHLNIKRLLLHSFDAVKTDFTEQLVLPQLTEIQVTGDYRTLTPLLEYLSMPQCRMIKMTFLHTPHPADMVPSDEEMVLGMTMRVVQRLAVPLQSLSNTLSFLRCEESKVELEFSPRLHDAPYWARDPVPDSLTIVMAFLPSGSPRGDIIVRNVVHGWMLAQGLENIACLELPDDSFVAIEYGDIFRAFIRHPLFSVKRLICSLEWARVLVDGELTAVGIGRHMSVAPPLEVILEQDGNSVVPLSVH